MFVQLFLYKNNSYKTTNRLFRLLLREAHCPSDAHRALKGALEDFSASSLRHAREGAKGEKEKKIGLPSHGPRVTSNLAHIISPDSTPVHLTIVLYLLPSPLPLLLLLHLPFHSPRILLFFSLIAVHVYHKLLC